MPNRLPSDPGSLSQALAYANSEQQRREEKPIGFTTASGVPEKIPGEAFDARSFENTTYNRKAGTRIARWMQQMREGPFAPAGSTADAETDEFNPGSYA